jgi:hypothetical protein
MRRISFETYGVADSPYASDLFDDHSALRAPGAVDNLTHMIRHIEELSTASDIHMQIAFPELLNGGAALPLDAAIDLQRRWARQATAILQGHSVPRSIW